MFTELLQIEIWRKKLENAGYRVIAEAWEPDRHEPHLDDWRERRERRERTTNPQFPPSSP